MTFTRLGLDYNQWIDREAFQEDMEKRIEERERMAEPIKVIPFNRDAMLLVLQLKPEQWNVLIDSTKLAGELTAEELITEALQEWMTRRAACPATGERKL